MSPERFATARIGSPDLLDARRHDLRASIGLDARFSGASSAARTCVVAGLPVAAAVFEMLSAAPGLFEPVEVFPLVAEGARVQAGTPVAEVEGVAAAVLAAERTALDFLMVLSGIATETARWVDAAGPELAVCDTRKTLPGLRALSKYAVRVGGGTNHRAGLYDMVLVKDNHIAACRRDRGCGGAGARGPPRAGRRGRGRHGRAGGRGGRAGADIVLLDNMDDASSRRGGDGRAERPPQAAGRRVLTEATGGITIERLPALRAAGVNRVSTSSLTVGIRVVDFGLDEA